jgi:hypothetical protein
VHIGTWIRIEESGESTKLCTSKGGIALSLQLLPPTAVVLARSLSDSLLSVSSSPLFSFTETDRVFEDTQVSEGRGKAHIALSLPTTGDCQLPRAGGTLGDRW